MKHIIELERADLLAIFFGDGLKLPSGEDCWIKGKVTDIPELTAAIALDHLSDGRVKEMLTRPQSV